MEPKSFPRWIIGVAFGAVVLAFLLASAAFLQVTGIIQAETHHIAENASQSIEHLATSRVSLVQLRDFLTDQVDNCERGRPVELVLARGAEQRLRDETNAYMRLPAWPEEVELQRSIGAGLTELHDEADQAGTLLREGHCEAAREFIEGPMSALISRTSLSFIADVDVNARHAAASAATIRRTHQKATRLAVLLNIAAILVALTAAVTMAINLQRRERFAAERARLQEERAHELEQFAARVAHDIRSPLAAVFLSLDLAQRRDDAQTWVAKGRKGLTRVEQIVEALYQFAAASGAPPPGRTARVSDVVQEVAESFRATEPNTAIELQMPPTVSTPVATPPGVVMTLLTNLLQNAIKYGGTSITVQLRREGERIRIAVADQGPGLSPEAQSRIFQPYFRMDRSREGGLGLGLATVKRLSEAYGGACGVISSPGQGATFWFELPIDSSPTPDAASPEEPPDSTAAHA